MIVIGSPVVPGMKKRGLKSCLRLDNIGCDSINWRFVRSGKLGKPDMASFGEG